MKKNMKAIRIDQQCSAEELVPKTVELPVIKEGYVLVEVKAFGINESEITSRKGESSSDFSFPRILGIEGVGIIADINKDSQLEVGQKIATMMGGLGRSIDGSYAEYMLVKEENVIPIDTQLEWSNVGALPEMLQTSYGSLSKGLQLKKDEYLLIRGGTSTVGLMAAIIAKSIGAKVISTSRSKNKLSILKKYGVDYPLLDDENLDNSIKKITHSGVDKALELVGFSTLFQDINYLKVGGVICFTGALGGKWTLDNFSPYMIPNGVFFTSYAGEANDLPTEIFNTILKKIEKDEISVPIAKVYNGLEQVCQAQQNLESGSYIGKHVIVL